MSEQESDVVGVFGGKEESMLVKMAKEADAARVTGDLALYVKKLRLLQQEASSRKRKLTNAAKLMAGQP